MDQAEAATRIPPLKLQCSVIKAKGSQFVIPPDQACAMVRDHIVTALGREVVPVTGTAAMAGDWVVVRIEQRRPGSLVGRVRSSFRNVRRSPPELGVDVMDRDLMAKDVEALSRAVTGSIVQLARGNFQK